MATMQDISFDELFAEPQKEQPQEDSLETLFGDVGNGATKMAAGIRPMADAAQQEAYRRTDALAAAARSGGIRPYDDSMGAARRYAEHVARGQRAAEAFGKTHVGSAALQAKIDLDRRAQDLDWAKANLDAGIRRREIDTGLASESENAAGTLAQENARGMWGTIPAAAELGTAGIRRRSDRDAARFGALAQLGSAQINADTQRDVAEITSKSAEKIAADNARAQQDMLIYQNQQAALGNAASASKSSPGAVPVPSELVTTDDKGNYYRNGVMLSVDEGNKIKNALAYTDGDVDRLKRAGRLWMRDKGKYGTGKKAPVIYWHSIFDPQTGADRGRWEVLMVKDMEAKSESDKMHYIPASEINVEVETRLRKYVTGT